MLIHIHVVLGTIEWPHTWQHWIIHCIECKLDDKIYNNNQNIRSLFRFRPNRTGVSRRLICLETFEWKVLDENKFLFCHQWFHREFAFFYAWPNEWIRSLAVSCDKLQNSKILIRLTLPWFGVTTIFGDSLPVTHLVPIENSFRQQFPKIN